MRRLIAAGITALAITGAVAGGGSASAAATTTGTQSVQQAPAAAPPGYEYYSWYWTESNCENNGARLQVRGVIRNYACDQSPYLTYYLYVLY
jgi:hypothetical protein